MTHHANPSSPIRRGLLGRLAAALILCCYIQAVAAQDALPPVAQPEPRPMPASVMMEGGLRLETYFPSLIQAGVGLLRLSGDGIGGADFTFRGETGAFFPVADDGWYALVRADMDTPPRAYELEVRARSETGVVTFSRDLRVDAAGYILQHLTLVGDRAYLIDRDIEEAEFARLAELTRLNRPEALWDAAGFELPLQSALSTPFGAFRILNEERETRHTGWDQLAAVGTPIRALAAGEVLFAGRLEIRGNTVVIDHGYGVFSAYAHFSELQVSAGMRVGAGQIIGLSGNTGRSTGPHLHWEALLRGDWVDGLAFLDLWLPA